jgi:HEPN domain-containing protein
MAVDEVREIFEDADRLYQEALRDLEEGRLRKAAENAWCATLRATNALILARTGRMPEYVPETREILEELAIKHPEVDILIGRFYTRETFLHGHCFYLGRCPPEPVRRRIIETKAYIEDAKNLAGITT